jgi:hypothetical protein
VTIGLVVVAAAIVAAFAPLPAWLLAHYRPDWYLPLQPVVTGFSSRVPFSLLDGLIGFALIVLLLIWVRRLARAPRGRRFSAAASAVWWSAVGAAALYLVFLATWGLNYRVAPLAQQLDADPARVTDRAIERFAEAAVGELNALHDEAHAALWPHPRELPATLGPAFAIAQRLLGASRLATPAAPKPTMLGPFFRRAAVAGMTDPFFLEVMITPDALNPERPAILAHEWGHLAGYANESEASFVGWLTCMQGDRQARYSGWLELYPRIAGSLPAPLRDKWARRLDAGPRADFAAIERRLRAAVVPAVNRAAWAGYDRFLKANRVADGVASYDSVVRLMAATAYDGAWRPRLRSLPRARSPGGHASSGSTATAAETDDR